MSYEATRAWAKTLLAEHKRVAICGGPRSGKSTVVQGIRDRPVIHTDDWSDHDWNGQPDHILDAVLGLDTFCIEGVQVARALRAGLEVDAILWLDDPAVERTPAQEAMAKGVATVFADWQRSEAANNTLVIHLTKETGNDGP